MGGGGSGGEGRSGGEGGVGNAVGEEMPTLSGTYIHI